MKILVCGGGGREHALLWKMAQDGYQELFCAPGNGGTKNLATNVDIAPTDIPKLLSFVEENDIDLTVVGADDPLALGIVNAFNAAGKRIFGPSQEAATLESSKVFSKAFMKRHQIPTAAYEVFENLADAQRYMESCVYPAVIKADGLALGKGVTVCENKGQALDVLDDIFVKEIFGSSGSQIVVEEFLSGQEVSVLAFSDGKNIAVMPAAQDHKQAFNFDKGPNTGGMGAYAPCTLFTRSMKEQASREIFLPTIEGMAREHRPFIGFLYFGLMLTSEGPKVIEYNARMGDPEAQVLMPLLETDLISVIEACIDGNLDTTDIIWKEATALGVVLASGGYPSSDFQRGLLIEGDLTDRDNSLVFQGGTTEANHKLVTSGGRVLTVVGLGENLDKASEISYNRVKSIRFDNLFYRTDIGYRMHMQ